MLSWNLIAESLELEGKKTVPKIRVITDVEHRGVVHDLGIPTGRELPHRNASHQEEITEFV